MLLRACLVGLVGLCAGGSWAADWNWSGSYLGVHGAHTSAQTRLSTTTEFVDPGYNLLAGTYFQASSVNSIAAVGLGAASSNAVSTGLTWGRNWQSGARVSGFEVDLGSMNLRSARSAGAVYPCCAPAAYQLRQSIETDWMLTARGRIGHASHRSLIYATAGLALVRLNVDARFSDNDPAARASTSLSTSRWGWAFGVGYEHGFDDGWSARAEVLHLELGHVSSTSNNLVNTAGAFPADAFTTRARLSANQFRVGLNKRW